MKKDDLTWNYPAVGIYRRSGLGSSSKEMLHNRDKSSRGMRQRDHYSRRTSSRKYE